MDKMKDYSTIWICILTFCAIRVAAEGKYYAISPKHYTTNSVLNNTKLSNSTRYCFHLTWMGINFNNRTFRNIMNKTCSQYFKDKKTLCINPMVATFTGGEPDLNYLLQNHPTSATCRLLQGQICAKYTVYHGSIVSYVTRYCTQIHVSSEGPMHSGCVQEKRQNDVIEVCACTSEPGPDGICNEGQRSAFGFSVFNLCLMSLAFW